MEISTKTIQKSVIYLDHIPRMVQSLLPIERMGFIHEKKEVIDRLFVLPSVLLIFRGGGVLEQDGRHIELQAPFLMWNLPGQRKCYWPDPSWDEIYIGFQPISENKLRRLFKPEFFQGLFRPIPHPADCMRYVSELLEVMRHPSLPGAVDRLDHLAMLILLEAVFPVREETLSEVELQLMKIIEHLELHFRGDIDLTQLAEEHGLSYSTFQRHWRAKYPFSPLQYLRKLRNSEAITLLRESTLSIGDIARQLGFRNQFYFAKFFRDMNGLSPSEFRHQQREVK